MLNKFDKEFWDMLDSIFDKCEIIIDRPKGSHHPKYNEYVYPLDYGFLKGTVSSDGSGIDVWVGTNKVKKTVGIISSVDLVKKDSEIKILYGCTEDEIELVYNMHNQTDGMKGVLTVRS